MPMLIIKFAQLFTLSGGIFNYCGDEAEALSVLHDIIDSENITSVFCCDEDLQKFLDVTKTPYTGLLCKQNNAAFITCEYLIAFDAKNRAFQVIIYCIFNNQMLPEKNHRYGECFADSGRPQRGHVKNKTEKPHKKITSISGGKSNLDNPNKKYPKLFLLLLED